MLQTIVLGTCVFIQGALVKRLADGRIVVRVGNRLIEGRPANV
jgi:hypothetical protein